MSITVLLTIYLDIVINYMFFQRTKEVIDYMPLPTNNLYWDLGRKEKQWNKLNLVLKIFN
jgi:hypothetical protein